MAADCGRLRRVPSFEMALTRQEFDRQLQPLLDGWFAESSGDGWGMKRGACAVSIRCRPLAVRRIGMIQLPCLLVDIVFDGGGSEEDEVLFFRRFHCCFQRGGG